MIHTVALDEVLTRLHICSRAEQTALYFMAYPGYNNLILCETTGSNPRPERYWRPHLADADTIQAIQEATQAFPLPDKSITRTQEQSIAIPIVHGDDTIGVVVHCYTGKGPKNLQALYHAVQQQSKNLFAGWVEFTIAEQSRPLSILFNIAGSISSSLDLDRVLLNVVEQATVLFRVKMSSLMLLNCKTQELEMQTAYGCSLEYLDKPNVPIHGSILGRVVLENNLIQVERIASEPAYLHKEFAKKEGVQSLLAAPISFKNTVLGVLNIYSSIPRRWQRSEMELLQTFANHAAVAITNARVHNQVVSMEEQLQVSAKLASVGELAAGLAHEIRNPLAVINMLIHSWKSSLPAPQDFADDVEVIAQKITDLNTLVSDLLSLARPRPLMKAVCNLQEMTERVLRLLHHRISLQKVQIESRFESAHNTAFVDRERIEQALLNLLLNALDVLPDGGKIEIATHDRPDKILIEIADTGPGIAPERIHELFKAFRSTKPTGIGLGLPLTKRIVEEHKGEILVTNHFPTGTLFSITLPVVEES